MMVKLNSFIILMAVIQLNLIQFLNASPSNKTLKAKSDLVHFYEKEINQLSKNYCVKFKNISEQILKEEIVQTAKTPDLLQFKANLTKFLQIYPLYTSLNLNKPLFSVFTKSNIKHYYQNNEDSRNILKLLQKHGYDYQLDQFERDFEHFASTKFLTKFEEFKKNLPSNETKDWQKLMQWGERLKQCSTYECYYKAFTHFDNIILTPKEQFLAFISQRLRALGLFYGNGTYYIAQGMLKHAKVPQLSLNVQQKIKRNLNYFIREYENARNITDLNKLFQFFHLNVLQEFLENKHKIVTEKDKTILKEIFETLGYAQFEKDYLKKFNNFIDNDLVKKLENFKANLKPEELSKENKLIEGFTNLKSLKTFDEKKSAIMKLMAMYYSNSNSSNGQ